MNSNLWLYGDFIIILNHLPSTPGDPFVWQAGYGVFSLGRQQLDRAVNYVNNQKNHHTNDTTISMLEIERNTDDSPEKYRISPED
jgi:hypothetical protein